MEVKFSSGIYPSRMKRRFEKWNTHFNKHFTFQNAFFNFSPSLIFSFFFLNSITWGKENLIMLVFYTWYYLKSNTFSK